VSPKTPGSRNAHGGAALHAFAARPILGVARGAALEPVVNGLHPNASIGAGLRRQLEQPPISAMRLQPRSRRSLNEALDGLQLLTVTDVCKLLRISKPTLWRIRRAGGFPEPTTVTERVFGWRRSEVDAWLASRPNSRRY
jgi:predicted DNA-binding transcriptional regulator AlpA